MANKSARLRKLRAMADDPSIGDAEREAFRQKINQLKFADTPEETPRVNLATYRTNDPYTVSTVYLLTALAQQQGLTVEVSRYGGVTDVDVSGGDYPELNAKVATVENMHLLAVEVTANSGVFKGSETWAEILEVRGYLTGCVLALLGTSEGKESGNASIPYEFDKDKAQEGFTACSLILAQNSQ